MGPRVRGDDAAFVATRLYTNLLHTQRHEPQLAVAVGDQQQHRLLAVLLELVDALLDIGGVADGFLRHFDDHLARAQPLLGGVGGAVDIGDDDALDAVLYLVAAAQVLAQRREIEAERLLRHRLFHRLLGLVGDLHRLVAAVVELAKRNLDGLLGALADDDDVYFLADGRIGNHARKILWLLDVLAVERDDHIARLDAGRFSRALVVDAGDQRAARRLDVEALGDLVGDLLDADTEPAAAQLAILPQLRHHAGHRLGR